MERQAAPASRRLSLLGLVSRDLLDGAQQLPSPWLVLLPVLVVRLRRSLAFPVRLPVSLVVEDLRRPASLRPLEASLPLVSQAERPASLPDFLPAELLPDLTHPQGGDDEHDVLAYLDDIPTRTYRPPPLRDPSHGFYKGRGWVPTIDVLPFHSECRIRGGVWGFFKTDVGFAAARSGGLEGEQDGSISQ